MTQPVSRRIAKIAGTVDNVFSFLLNSEYTRRQRDPTICDFVVGNPHEMPLPAFTQALQRWSVPQNENWFAYKFSEPAARAAVAASLRARRGMPFADEDIFLTNGASGALAISLGAILDPGDEVIFLSPPWFFYEAFITSAGGTPVRVKIDLSSFDLDLAAIEAAVTARTRAIIVNSPNNPTGKIYPPATLERLAALLTEVSARNGRTTYLLSDEAYNRIVYDRHEFHSPTEFYPNTFLLYTYGKQLLTPGQRLGYIALPPSMPERGPVRQAIMLSQFSLGPAVVNAVMQYALPDLENQSIDVAHLQAKRDRMVGALREMGYDTNVPEGTFYVLVRSPLSDDLAFIELLARHNVFCLPGSVFEMPGYFRISLTANDEMVERSLAGFESAHAEALRDGS